MKNVSIIIPTLNRPQALGTVLICIKNLTIKVQEVIIVNQGDNLQSLYDDWNEKLPLLLLSQECNNPSAARNLALSYAQGEWILFLDDDVSFEPDLLEKYFIVYKEFGFDGCNGGVIAPWEKKTTVLQPENESRFIGIWSKLSSYRTFSGSIEIIGTCSANLLIKRSVLIDICGFDERFWRLEDVELGIRINKAGYSLWHDGRPSVQHFHAPFGGSRNSIKTWEEKHFSAILPPNLGAQLLILFEHYSWVDGFWLIFWLFLTFIRPSRLYIQRPFLPFGVLYSEIKSIFWAIAAYRNGAKLMCGK